MVSLQVIALLLYADKTTTNRVPEAKTLTVRHGNCLGTIARVWGKSSKSTKTCTKTDAIYIDIVFEDLNLNEPSSRHHDREFCIAYKLMMQEIKGSLGVESDACLFSSKVLKRRRNIVLKALSTLQLKNWRVNQGVECMLLVVHLLKSKASGLISFVWRKNGKVFSEKSCYADNLELFSENVLFFDIAFHSALLDEMMWKSPLFLPRCIE